MTACKLLDSSVWLAYFFNGSFSEIVDAEEIFLMSPLIVFEVKCKLVRAGVDPPKLLKSIEFMKKKSIVIPLDQEVAELAVDDAVKYNLPAIDALIYATSLKKDSLLLTLDNDFRGLKNVHVLATKIM